MSACVFVCLCKTRCLTCCPEVSYTSAELSLASIDQKCRSELLFRSVAQKCSLELSIQSELIHASGYPGSFFASRILLCQQKYPRCDFHGGRSLKSTILWGMAQLVPIIVSFIRSCDKPTGFAQASFWAALFKSGCFFSPYFSVCPDHVCDRPTRCRMIFIPMFACTVPRHPWVLPRLSS